MVAATGSRSAMRRAMAAPIEWPSKIVLLGSSWPLWIRDSTAAVAHSCAWAKENASRLSPWPGKSNAYARKPWPAKSSARYIIRRRLAESPCRRTTLPAGFTSGGGSRTVIGVWQPPASSHSSCFGKFGDANPARAKREKYHADDGENDLPELHGALRGICGRHGRMMCLCFSAAADRGMGNWQWCRKPN